MARKTNGTSDGMSCVIDLSGFSLISIAWWMWWDGFANDDKLAFEYTANYNNVHGFVIDPNDSTTNVTPRQFGGGMSLDNTHHWTDCFIRPSANAWHHYVWIMNRATPSNVVYLDGALATLTADVHQAGTYGNFANSTLYMMSRNVTTLFAAGRMCEVGMWGGIALTASEAKSLANGVIPPLAHPDSLILYLPMLGNSPEPDYSGKQRSATLTGTTVAAHPWVQAGMIPRRGPQPMPT